EALTVADKVVVMHDGGVVQVGTPQELFEKPAHTFVGYFIGSPGMNFLEATVSGNVAIIDGVKIPLGAGYKPLSGKVQIGIRPEFVRLSAGNKGLEIKVRRVEDVGRHKIVRADFFGNKINIIVEEGVEIGAEMNRITFDPEKINVYVDDWLIEGEIM
ncbi:ABC transporter ATP-binding protein, partial [Marinosulfonomonas sp. PRT-SC04]